MKEILTGDEAFREAWEAAVALKRGMDVNCETDVLEVSKDDWGVFVGRMVDIEAANKRNAMEANP